MADPMDEKKKSKPALGLIIGVGKGDDVKDDATTDEDEESSEDYSAAVGELFDAIQNGDKAAFAESFKAAVMSCK